MAEDARKIQRRPEQDALMTILLQPSPLTHRAQCWARECLIANASPRGDSPIIADYGIALVSDRFHIWCLKEDDRPSIACAMSIQAQHGYSSVDDDSPYT